MLFRDFQFYRQVTKPMLEFLIECHERELLNQTPLEATIGTVSGLIKRQLVEVRFCTDPKGKQYMGVYLNQKGRAYLKKYA